jgi:hypothetical protein
MGTDREAFTKITEALKHQADRLIDLQFDLFALAAAMKNQLGTDQVSFEQDFRAVRLVLGKGARCPSFRKGSFDYFRSETQGTRGVQSST